MDVGEQPLRGKENDESRENKLNPTFGGCDDTLAKSEDKEHQYFENFRRINRQIF